MIKVNYDNSLLSLAASVLKKYGASVNHKTLPQMDELLNCDFKNVVVMLFDGMGKNILEKHLPADSFLRSHCIDTISSVFPPTTTAATTSIESGLSPIEHGWLGWALRFEQVGNKNVCLFPNTLLNSNEKAADFHVARTYIPYENIFDKIERVSNGEVKAYCVSAYSGICARSVDEICDNVKKLCTQNGRKYIYTYSNQPDYDIHDLGTAHGRIREHLEEINQKVEKLCEQLTDTLVIVTADHGLIDTKWLYLDDYPDVRDCLVDIPSIECRTMSMFVKDGMKEKFERAFNKHFGEYYELIPHERVFEQKLFGDGDEHPLVRTFVGDYIAVAKTEVSISPAQKTDDVFKAVHAGATKEEFEVPFIVQKPSLR